MVTAYNKLIGNGENRMTYHGGRSARYTLAIPQVIGSGYGNVGGRARRKFDPGLLLSLTDFKNVKSNSSKESSWNRRAEGPFPGTRIWQNFLASPLNPLLIFTKMLKNTAELSLIYRQIIFRKSE